MLAISRRSSAFTISATRAFPMPLPCTPRPKPINYALHAVALLFDNAKGFLFRSGLA